MKEVNRIIKNAIRDEQQDLEYQRHDHSSIYNYKTEIALFICVFAIFFWSAFAELSITVSARGELKQISGIEKIQHLEGGIIEEIFIHEGDIVHIGQPIARLLASDRATDLNAQEIEITSLQIEAIRLESLIDNTVPDYGNFNHLPGLVKASKNAWREDKEKFESELSLIQNDLNHKRDLTTSMKRRLTSANTQLALIDEQLKIKEDLYHEEVASYMDVLNMRVQKSNMTREIENLEEGVLSNQFEIKKLEISLTDLQKKESFDNISSLQEIKEDMKIKHARIPSAVDKVNRLTIYSPVDGKVDKIHYNYKSAIVPPGEGFADIVPLKSSIVAEIKIPRKDIGFIEIGQVAKIKIDTYSYTKYGSINARILSVSRAPYEEKEELYYIAKASLETNFVKDSNKRYFIAPHMEVTADIITGSRSALDYAIKPIVNALESAFKER